MRTKQRPQVLTSAFRRLEVRAYRFAPDVLVKSTRSLPHTWINVNHHDAISVLAANGVDVALSAPKNPGQCEISLTAAATLGDQYTLHLLRDNMIEAILSTSGGTSIVHAVSAPEAVVDNDLTVVVAMKRRLRTKWALRFKAPQQWKASDVAFSASGGNAATVTPEGEST
jgi:hypothetical protein